MANHHVLACFLVCLAVAACRKENTEGPRPPLDVKAAAPGDASGSTVQRDTTASDSTLANPSDSKSDAGGNADIGQGAGQASDAVSTADETGNDGRKSTQEPAAIPSAKDVAAIEWTITPRELEVMRDTKVALAVKWPSAPQGSVRYLWDPGDRTGELSGQTVEHVFTGGLNDRTVSLIVEVEGQVVFKDSRALPVERLPVMEMAESDYALPRMGDSSGVRVMLVGAFSNPTQEDSAALRQAVHTTSSSLVVLFFNQQISSEAAGGIVSAVAEGAGVAVLPVYCSPAGMNGNPPDPVLTPDIAYHSSSADKPFRYTLMQSSLSITVLDSRYKTGSVDMEKWLLDELNEAKVVPHRIVLSCLPMEPYSSPDAGSLSPPFRYYEKLQRGDITLFASSGYPVFYLGRYGQVASLSVGAGLGTPGVLVGATSPQEPLLSVAEFVPGQPARVFPVRVSDPGVVVGTRSWPMKVGSYQKILQAGLAPLPTPVETPSETPAAVPGESIVDPAEAEEQDFGAETPAPKVLPPGRTPAVGVYPPVQ